jgi:hypothetical protein
LHGNKRTARFFRNILLYGRKGYFFDWNYDDKRIEYQKIFTEGCITGEFSLIMELHKDAQIYYGESKHDDIKNNLQSLWGFVVGTGNTHFGIIAFNCMAEILFAK